MRCATPEESDGYNVITITGNLPVYHALPGTVGVDVGAHTSSAPLPNPTHTTVQSPTCTRTLGRRCLKF